MKIMVLFHQFETNIIDVHFNYDFSNIKGIDSSVEPKKQTKKKRNLVSSHLLMYEINDNLLVLTISIAKAFLR